MAEPCLTRVLRSQGCAHFQPKQQTIRMPADRLVVSVLNTIGVTVPATTTCPSPRWFAVYTASRHEKNVSALLDERNVESFLPLYRTVRVWKNRTKAELELPLFPSYLFVRIPASERGKVLSVPGVFSLVGSKHEAWPMPDSEIEGIRSGLDHRKAEPHAYLVIGDRVKIKSGPMVGMEGILVQKPNGPRVVLSLQQIMRSVSVEVGLHELEGLTPKIGLAS